jgi:GPH family glycoside/pentoside/hexuronide:cation symporter
VSSEAPLDRRLILGWGIGSLGASTLHNGVGFLALYFLSQVMGLAPATAGALILAAKVYDIVLDPVMGVVSDRTRSRLGRRRPWLLVGALLSGAAFVLLFNPPVPTGAGLMASAALALVLYATGYTVFGIPYLAMPAEMTGDYHERSRLMSARTVCLSLGILAGGALGPVLAAAFGGGATGYRSMSLVLGALITGTMLLAFLGTRRARATAPPDLALTLREQWSTALGNRPFLVLIAAKFCHLTGVAVSMSSLIYLVTLLLGRPESAMAGFVLASAVGSIGSMPLWLALSRRLGKRNAYWLATAAYLPVLLSWWLAAPGESEALFLARGLLTGLATGGLTLTAQSMLPDTIAWDHARTGQRREGSFAAVYTVSEKLASAGGPFLLGLVLQAADTGPAEAAQPGAILLAAVLVPAAATALGALALAGYDLDRPSRRDQPA